MLLLQDPAVQAQRGASAVSSISLGAISVMMFVCKNTYIDHHHAEQNVASENITKSDRRVANKNTYSDRHHVVQVFPLDSRTSP